MIKIQKLLSAAWQLIAAAAIITLAAQCSEDDILTPEAVPAAQTAATEMEDLSEAGSLTIAGIYTSISEGEAQCSSCTFVVPAGLTVIDGLKLDLKPGAVICIGQAMRSKSLEFVNLSGTEESPITISYCGE